MYRSDLQTKDRGGAVAAVIAIHAALLYAFLNISGRMPVLDGTDEITELIEVPLRSPPPPPPPPPQQRQQQQKPKEKEGGSPANIRSQATPVVAPKPRVQPQRPNPIVVAERPGEGAEPTQGAADVRGPGTGAGGTGTGTGTGSGSGSGGGGDGGVVQPPRLVTPVLRGRDFPRDMLEEWPRGAPVFLRLRVDARGYVSECVMDRRTGVPAIDSQMCNLAYQRLRFRPALNRAGQPVAGWFGYAQPAPR
jgi:periplasmic protein TonB